MARREKGEGTLYQAKDKSWVYQYSVDGKRKTKRFRRKTDAKAFMAALTTGQTEISVEKLSIVPQQAEPITVGEWMDRWLEKYAKPIVKLSTYCSYEQLIRSHVKPQIGSRYINTLTGEDLQDFFNERRAQGAGQPETERGSFLQNADKPAQYDAPGLRAGGEKQAAVGKPGGRSAPPESRKA